MSRRRRKRGFPKLPLLGAVVLAFATILGVGVVHGIWSARWDLSDEPETSARRLDAVPMQIGDWEARALDLPTRQLVIGEIANYLHRVYTNKRTGTSISVLLLCGRGGPISVHTPDVCYRGLGYTFSKTLTRFPIEVGDPAALPEEFNLSEMFKAHSPETTTARIFWGWNATGQWTAPSNPRFTLSRYPALFKMYVVRELIRSDEPLEDEPTVDFLKIFLPELKRTLFPKH